MFFSPTPPRRHSDKPFTPLRPLPDDRRLYQVPFLDSAVPGFLISVFHDVKEQRLPCFLRINANHKTTIANGLRSPPTAHMLSQPFPMSNRHLIPLPLDNPHSNGSNL